MLEAKPAFPDKTHIFECKDDQGRKYNPYNDRRSLYPSVIRVIPQADYVLELTFSNGESGTLDMKPYLNFGVFTRLKDYGSFQKVSVVFDTIEWDVGADLDPEFVYEKCSRQPNIHLARY